MMIRSFYRDPWGLGTPSPNTPAVENFKLIQIRRGWRNRSRGCTKLRFCWWDRWWFVLLFRVCGMIVGCYILRRVCGDFFLGFNVLVGRIVCTFGRLQIHNLDLFDQWLNRGIIRRTVVDGCDFFMFRLLPNLSYDPVHSIVDFIMPFGRGLVGGE